MAIFGAIGGTAKVLLLPWADKKEDEYRRGLGKRLATIVYILSGALVVVTAIGPSIELGKKPDAARIQKQPTSPAPGAVSPKANQQPGILALP
ncbi:MAG TPA: hypothetical protein VK403_13040 [Allosphingosinicella sp.]|nr:hypothetical protein [Allosphingosinicella sp.]